MFLVQLNLRLILTFLFNSITNDSLQAHSNSQTHTHNIRAHTNTHTHKYVHLHFSNIHSHTRARSTKTQSCTYENEHIYTLTQKHACTNTWPHINTCIHSQYTYVVTFNRINIYSHTNLHTPLKNCIWN